MSDPVPVSLAERYQRLRQRYDLRAQRCKLSFRILSLSASVSTWLSLVFVVLAGLTFPDNAALHDLVLHYLIPVLSTIVLLASSVLAVCDLQGRWKEARRAAERLRSDACLYRARLPPYADDKRDQVFERLLERAAGRAEQRQGELYLDLRHWRHYLTWARPTPHDDSDPPHTPDQPDALVPAVDFQTEERALLDGRLYNQQRWLRRRSQTFALRLLLGFQLPVLAISAFNMLYTLSHGRTLWIVGLTTALTLMLFALRDQLDYGPLFARYVRVHGNLDDLRRAYLVAAGRPSVTLPPYVDHNPFAALDETARLRLLVQLTERVLSAESESWYVGAH